MKLDQRMKVTEAKSFWMENKLREGFEKWGTSVTILSGELLWGTFVGNFCGELLWGTFVGNISWEH